MSILTAKCKKSKACVYTGKKIGTASLKNSTDGVCAFLQLCIKSTSLSRYDERDASMKLLFFFTIVIPVSNRQLFLYQQSTSQIFVIGIKIISTSLASIATTGAKVVSNKLKQIILELFPLPLVVKPVGSPWNRIMQLAFKLFYIFYTFWKWFGVLQKYQPGVLWQWLATPVPLGDIYVHILGQAGGKRIHKEYTTCIRYIDPPCPIKYVLERPPPHFENDSTTWNPPDNSINH